MTHAQTCERPDCNEIAVGYIPLPDGARRNDINLCGYHVKQARANLYYVVDYGQRENGPGVREYLDLVEAKHLRLRGTLEIRVPLLF